jgi:hypothetical protein
MTLLLGSIMHICRCQPAGQRLDSFQPASSTLPCAWCLLMSNSLAHLHDCQLQWSKLFILGMWYLSRRIWRMHPDLLSLICIDALSHCGVRCRCTGVVAVVKDRQAWIAHVGDSRAVLVRASGRGVKPCHSSVSCRPLPPSATLCPWKCLRRRTPGLLARPYALWCS